MNVQSGNFRFLEPHDALPKIAITVDLLTTGIDVPSITNLVFVRRVNSGILYEQMLGRATRLCDEIGKETFRIFDAVDLYPHLENLTDMKPVVVDPALSFEQLLQELTSVTDDGHRSAIRDQLAVKWSRKVRRFADEARRRYRAAAGEEPEARAVRRYGATRPAAAESMFCGSRSCEWPCARGLRRALTDRRSRPDG